MFYRLGPREKDSTPNKKKTRPVRVFFFAPRTPLGSLTLLFVEMFYRLGPREKDSTPNKKKNVQCAFFFLLRARPGLTHSRFFLWKWFIGSAPERRTAHRTKKKNTSSARFFFCSPRGPGSLTHLFRSSNIINVGNRKRNARGTKKNRKWHAYGAKKKMRVPPKPPCAMTVQGLQEPIR